MTFDLAFDRWRDLFRSALVDQWEQNRRRLDYSLSQRDRDIAGRRRNEAETQLRLLRNEDSDDRNLTADFNPYRYLASEGFLPWLLVPAGCQSPPTSRPTGGCAPTATSCSAPGSWRSGSSARAR